MKNLNKNLGKSFVSVYHTKPILKNQKGITLIALVITIIIMLILAGITLNMLTGENNILKVSATSAYKHGESKGIEKIELVLGEDAIERTEDKTKPVLDEERLLTIFDPKKEE